MAGAGLGVLPLEFEPSSLLLYLVCICWAFPHCPLETSAHGYGISQPHTAYRSKSQIQSLVAYLCFSFLESCMDRNCLGALGI